jgi:hypothetical protein
MQGVVNYVGPLPCSRDGHIVGAAVMTIFNERLLPPPTGLGLSSHRIAVVPGDVLFAGVADQIPFNANGDLACPPPGHTVTVAASWEVGPIDPGRYQVRGLYDWDGDFSAAFKMANMPTAGDVGGGALDNVTGALAGEAPKYTLIQVGNGPDGDGKYTIPENGIVVSNITVLLGLVIPTNRPYFHVSLLQRGKDASGTRPDPEPYPERISLAADLHLFSSNSAMIHESLPTLTLAAGLPENEVAAGAAPPFYMHLDYVEDAFGPLFVQSYDANRDGAIDGKDHITGSSLVPAFGPIVSLTKMDREHDVNNLWRSTQDKPRVLSSLIIGPPTANSLLEVVGYGLHLEPDWVPAIKAFLRPSAVCIENAADPNSKTVIVTPYEFDQSDPPNQIINAEATRQDIAEQLARNFDNTEIAYACLPPGIYAMNVIVPATGQAWTLPNESGNCMPGEERTNGPDGPMCGARRKLESQFRYVEFGAADDPAYCNGLREHAYGQLIRQYCLTPSEQQKFDDGTLWNAP